jgi:hypothetical protein
LPGTLVSISATTSTPATPATPRNTKFSSSKQAHVSIRQHTSRSLLRRVHLQHLQHPHPSAGQNESS